MFAFLTRSRRPVPPRRFVRPVLERLETRFCPSAALTLNYAFTSGNNVNLSGNLTGAANNANQTVQFSGVASGSATTDANGHFSVTLPAAQLGTESAFVPAQMSNVAQVAITALAPAITNFTAIQEEAGVWEFKGTVTGTPDPAGMIITFGGLSALAGQTTTVAANGTFDFSFFLNGQTGNATAVTTDWWNRTSNTATDLVST
jgi:hypothetical protein